MVLSDGPTADPSRAVAQQRAKDSSCFPALHLPGGAGGAQGTLSSQSAGAGPREEQGPRRPGKEKLDGRQTPFLSSRRDDLHVRDCWEQPGALPFHKRLMDTGEAIILF